MLLGVCGRRPFRDKSIPNWVCVPWGNHSEKPDVFRKLVETVSDDPRLELFGRKAVPGWTVFGNQFSPTAPMCSAGLFSDIPNTEGS